MGKTILAILVLFSVTAGAKTQSLEIKYKDALKKIACVFKGKTSTPPNVGTMQFPADPQESVCNPMSSVPSSNPENGLIGKLLLKTPEMTDTKTVLDYFSKGQRLEKNLYFADVSVTTRSFSEGFSTVDGQVLMDAQGNKLVENFGIEYSSILKLSDEDEEGHYELASLADDGARVFVQENSAWNEIVNNDGRHATRLGCASRTIQLSKGQELPIKILYYQGPRYHIANVLLWRHLKKSKEWKNWRHGLCGMTGTAFFSEPKGKEKITGMNILEKMGYRTIASKNFKMPEQKQNPCTVEELRIADHSMTSLTSNSATIIWTTNLPATSQLRILNLYTGEEIFTAEDKNLVTEHRAEISGLMQGGYYMIQSISKDSYGREARSSFITAQP